MLRAAPGKELNLPPGQRPETESATFHELLRTAGATPDEAGKLATEFFGAFRKQAEEHPGKQPQLTAAQVEALPRGAANQLSQILGRGPDALELVRQIQEGGSNISFDQVLRALDQRSAQIDKTFRERPAAQRTTAEAFTGARESMREALKPTGEALDTAGVVVFDKLKRDLDRNSQPGALQPGGPGTAGQDLLRELPNIFGGVGGEAEKLGGAMAGAAQSAQAFMAAVAGIRAQLAPAGQAAPSPGSGGVQAPAPVLAIPVAPAAAAPSTAEAPSTGDTDNADVSGFAAGGLIGDFQGGSGPNYGVEQSQGSVFTGVAPGSVAAVNDGETPGLTPDQQAALAWPESASAIAEKASLSGETLSSSFFGKVPGPGTFVGNPKFAYADGGGFRRRHAAARKAFCCGRHGQRRSRRDQRTGHRHQRFDPRAS